MNDEELCDYLKRFCFGREHLICSRDLVRQKNLRESDLRKKVNRLRRKAVPIASSREGYFYASNAAELYELKHDAEKHWQECSVCHTKTNEEAHSGGTATCTAKAVCTTCGAEYP